MKGRRFKVQDSNHPLRNKSLYRNVAQPIAELYSNREQGRNNVLDGYSHHDGVSRSLMLLNSNLTYKSVFAVPLIHPNNPLVNVFIIIIRWQILL